MSRDGVEIARAGEADEMLWDVLGIAPGSGRAVDQAAFGLLWVEQGQSFALPVPSGKATDALNAAIQAEVGALVGGERARTLLAELDRELAEQLTETTGKPKAGGALSQALERARQLGEDLKEVEARLAGADQQTARLVEARTRHAGLSDPAETKAMAEELAATEADLARAREAGARLGHQELVQAAARAARETAERALAEIEARAVRIDRARADEAELAAKAQELAQREDGALAQIKAAQDEIELLRAGEANDAVALVRLDRLRDMAELASRRPELTARRETLAGLAARLAAIEAELAGLGADPKALDELEAIEREIDMVRARFEAGAARLVVESLRDGAVTLDGAPLSGRAAIALTRETEVEVAGLARIRAIPPAGFGLELDARKEALERRRADLLLRFGAADAAALRAQVEARRRQESGRAEALATLKALGSAPGAVATELAALDAELARIAGALAAAGAETAPRPEELAAERTKIEARREEARRHLARLDGRKDAAHRELQQILAERARHEAERTTLRRALEGELGLLPDTERADMRGKAVAALDAARAAVAVEEAALARLKAETADAHQADRLLHRQGRLKSAIEGRRHDLSEIDRAIANLEGQIQSVGGEGLGERAAALADERDLWLRIAARHERRLATLKLLREVIQRGLDERRERLDAPVKRHLKPYLDDLFGQADVTLAPGFAVEEVSRDGSGAQRYALLSDGAKEQVAVLTRLAMGSLLAERGLSVPIILDDALVYSDDERIERMFDALNRVAGCQQVIVFTCRNRAFARLGGRRLQLVES